MIRTWSLALLLSADVSIAAPLILSGEIVARSSAMIVPPSVEELWHLTITRLTPDGMLVKSGDIVLVFDGGEIEKRLVEQQSALKEKQTQLENLRLDLVQREKDERLATEQQRAVLEKAQRKASQPTELLRRVDYQKLMIERRQAERQMVLAQRREVLATEQRRQELRLIEAETQQLESEAAQLEQSLVALSVRAPRAGVLLHKSNRRGEKFDAGTQVWRGQTIAEIPDLTTLAVRAQLPERELLQLTRGARARITVEGGTGRTLAGTVERIGHVVRSKSRVQPVPVLDVELSLEGDLSGLKPGQPVRVEVFEVAAARIAP